MSVRMLTKPLIGFLADLIHTADPEDGSHRHAIMVHTARGGFAEDPGEQDLWCGVSTTGFVVGHTYTTCTGQLSGGPCVWSVRDARSIIAVFKAPAKEDDHTVEIVRDGDMVTVAEDPNLFDEGLSLTFAQQPIENFPGAGLYLTLADERPAQTADAVRDQEHPALPRTDYVASKIDPFVKVASRRKAELRMYRSHQARRVLVQVGPSFRGAITPTRYEPDGPEAMPDAELHSPDLHDLLRRVQLAKARADPKSKKDQGPPELTLLEPLEDDE